MRFDRQTLWAWRGGLGVLLAVGVWSLSPLFGPPLVAAAGLNWWMTSRHRATESGSAESIWDVAALGMVALVFMVYFQLLTHGTGQLLQFELLGAAYDSLAASLMRGSSEIRPLTIHWEGMMPMEGIRGSPPTPTVVRTN